MWVGRISKKLLATLAVSLAIHAGVVFAPSEQVRATPASIVSKSVKLPQEVMHEEPIQPEAEERRPQVDAQALTEDRDRFVQKVLAAVRRNEHIPLSDFLMESRLLDWNIRAAEKGEPLIELGEMKAEYRRLLEKAPEHLPDEKNRTKALHQFMHARVLSTYFGGSDSIIDVLKSGWYNCFSSTEAFSAMHEDVLSIRPSVVVLGDHIRSFLDGKSIENTESDWGAAFTRYDQCGIVTSSDVFITAYLLGHGVPEEEIPRRLMRPYRQRAGGRNCIHESGDIPEFSSLGGLMLPATDDFSGWDVPPYPVPNRGFLGSTKTEDIVKMAKVLLAAYRLSHSDELVEGIAGEMNGQGNMFADAFSIPPGVKWGEIFGFYSREVMFPPGLFSAWSERLRRYFYFYTIPAASVSTLAEMAAQSGDKSAEHFTRESICNADLQAIENEDRAPWPWDSYYPFGSCGQINELVMKRYRIERKNELLRQLVALDLPENFEFFLGELRSEDMATQMAAAQGLVLSDRTRGCEELKRLADKDEGDTEFDNLEWELVFDCSDSEVFWENISDPPGRIGNAAIDSFADAKTLTAAQRELLKDFGRWENADPYVKMSLGRIFYESGDRETARVFFEEGLQEGQKQEWIAKGFRCSFPYGIPLEFLPLLKTVMSDSRCALEIAASLELTPNAGFQSSLVEPLRKLVRDEDAELEKRIHAAFLLLKHGIDPL